MRYESISKTLADVELGSLNGLESGAVKLDLKEPISILGQRVHT